MSIKPASARIPFRAVPSFNVLSYENVTIQPKERIGSFETRFSRVQALKPNQSNRVLNQIDAASSSSYDIVTSTLAITGLLTIAVGAAYRITESENPRVEGMIQRDY